MLSCDLPTFREMGGNLLCRPAQKHNQSSGRNNIFAGQKSSGDFVSLESSAFD